MLSFFPRGVLDEILDLIESVSEGFPSYSLVQSQHLHVFYDDVYFTYLFILDVVLIIIFFETFGISNYHN